MRQMTHSAGYLAIAALVLMPPSGALAHSHGNETDYSGGHFSGDGSGAVGSGSGVASAGVAAAVVAVLTEGARFCKSLTQTEYLVDCLAERMDAAARKMAHAPAYSEAHTALSGAASRLRGIAQANRSATEPAARFQAPGANGVRTSRELVPVDRRKLRRSASQALAVVQETEAVLLRSSEGSDQNAAQYSQIARAVGANKVLLRTVT